jgi:hypothetical protein
MLSSEQVRERLKTACEEAGSQAAWAREHGMSAAYLHDVINGRRNVGKAILRALGLERVVRYAPQNGNGGGRARACDHQSGSRAGMVPKKATP